MELPKNGKTSENGWYDLIHTACQNIHDYSTKYNLGTKMTQIKEKFGQLRLYYHTDLLLRFQEQCDDPVNVCAHIEAIDKICFRHEQESIFICEECGLEAKQTFRKKDGGRIQTLCNNCAIKLEYCTTDSKGPGQKSQS